MFVSDDHQHQSETPNEFGKFERIASDLLSLPDHIQDAFSELHYLMNEPLLNDDNEGDNLTMREGVIIVWYRQQDEEIKSYIQLFVKALKYDDDKSCPYCGLSYNASHGAACEFCRDEDEDDGWIYDDDCPYYDEDPRSDQWYRNKNRRNHWN